MSTQQLAVSLRQIVPEYNESLHAKRQDKTRIAPPSYSP